jgi:hypothetical protein
MWTQQNGMVTAKGRENSRLDRETRITTLGASNDESNEEWYLLILTVDLHPFLKWKTRNDVAFAASPSNPLVAMRQKGNRARVRV